MSFQKYLSSKIFKTLVFPWWDSGEDPALPLQEHRFNLWSAGTKIPHYMQYEKNKIFKLLIKIKKDQILIHGFGIFNHNYLQIYLCYILLNILIKTNICKSQHSLSLLPIKKETESDFTPIMLTNMCVCICMLLVFTEECQERTDRERQILGTIQQGGTFFLPCATLNGKTSRFKNLHLQRD